ncbi:MAG: ABC transporter substrate-binding protein [Rhodoferax sp.]|nr:ABC transporter substrate-binding protein [Rhodoferax sp.]
MKVHAFLRPWLAGAVLALAAGLLPLGAQAQTRGGTLTVILNPEPPTLVLGLNTQGPTLIVGGKIYEGLLTYHFDLSPRPGLARSWTVSPDGLTYTFKLQEGVRWHDGKPFTADDVIFSLQTLLQETHPRASVNFSRVAEYLAPDPLTVVFKLREPYAPFLGAFEVSSAPILPAHIYRGTDYRNNPANQTPIGTGPFKFKEWRKGQSIQLVRNDDYWQKGLPYLDAVNFQIIPDSASRLRAMESGTAQVASFSDIDFDQLPHIKTNPNLALTTKGYEFSAPLVWLELNHRVKPLDDRRFRQALLYALDRQAIARDIFAGSAKPATGPISSATRFFDPNIPQYAYDPKKAMALLDAMGLKPDARGNRTTLRLLELPYGSTWSRLAGFIKQSLGKVGINVVLESTEAGNWARRYANWEYEMTITYLYQYGDPALGVARNYISSNIRKGVYASNTSGYSNAEVDQWFSAAAVAVRPDSRQVLYSRVARQLAQDVPEAWLVEMSFPTITNVAYKNVVTSAIGVMDNFATTYKAK